MNVTFHVITAIAVTSVAAKTSSIKYVPSAATCFVSCLLLHGVLDMLPHGYPFRSRTDICIGLLLFPVTIYLLPHRSWGLFLFSYLGAISCDLIDLGPQMLNRAIGVDLRLESPIFPWHTETYSGSIFDGTRQIESAIYHSLVVITCALAIAHNRDVFRKLS